MHLYGGQQLKNELSYKTMVQEPSEYTHTLGKCPFPPVNVSMPLSSAQQIISNVDFQPHSLPGCLYSSGSSVSCSPLMGCEGTACGLREGVYNKHKKLFNTQLSWVTRENRQNMSIYVIIFCLKAQYHAKFTLSTIIACQWTPQKKEKSVLYFFLLISQNVFQNRQLWISALCV